MPATVRRIRDSTYCYHLMMAKTVTLRLSDSAYEAVKQYAEADQKSMNARIETLLDAEDMRRRCKAHDQWMREHPQLPLSARRGPIATLTT